MDYISKHKYASPLSIPCCPLARFTTKHHEFNYVQFGESSSLIFQSHISPRYINDMLVFPKLIKTNKVLCRICENPLSSTPSYSCGECVSYFHKECVEPISNHPYHPKHSLRLFHIATLYGEARKCLFCSYGIDWFYNCSLCEFTICRSCARKPPLFAIDNLKRHEHTLFYFPRKGYLFCDVCALNDHHESIMYDCTRCDYFVHKDCIYLPYIIRISRHEHRLSFSSLLTPEKWFCGVCRDYIDTSYGRYSCVKGCSYGVHTKCATRKDVWDGKELEGKPEDVFEDISSFNEISDGVIQHFSHQYHHMRLDKETNIEVHDEEKRCCACTLPIYDSIVYKCVQCDFILHQTCAHLPRKKQHLLHPHPLSLQVDVSRKGWFSCTVCDRRSNGFAYKCLERGCKFKLDICCSYITEPFGCWYHLAHCLFLTYKPQSLHKCSICRKHQYTCLNCYICGFDVCIQCATLPKKLRYKHDEHFLIHLFDEDVSDQYLCDVCETKADPKKDRIYMCKECNVMVHMKCLLGEMDMYMMPGKIISYGTKNVNILFNNHLTRNICWYCQNRCQGYIVYKAADLKIFCSFYCMIKLYDICEQGGPEDI